jgi:cytochrome d ubiquinol oxidase subunit I
MNSPTGFDFVNGKYTNIDPIKAMFNPAWFSQALHMSIAAFAATGFAVAGVHALMIVRKMNINFHQKAFRIAAVFGVVASILQPLSGDISAKMVAKRQPAKLAAMEAHFKTEEYSPLIIGGIPDVKNKKVNYALELPGLLSFMVHDNFKTPVKGLDQIPEKDQPPVAVTHYSFQLMVALGMLMMTIGVVYFIALIKKRDWFNKDWFLRLFIAATPIGFIAVEAGWTVTEVGRQPWIIQGIMRTKDAVTPMPGIGYSFYLFTAVYLTLSIVVIFLLYRQIRMVPQIYDTTKPVHAKN